MIQKMITRAFAARNAAHIEHWKTKNGEQHRALGEFYDGVIDAVDKYVEAHQGLFGIVGKVPGEDKDVTEMLRNEMLWLCENRSAIAKDIPALENILDEMCALYLTTLYKLDNLR